MGIYDRPYYQDNDSPNLTPSWDQRSAIATIIIACVGVFLANMIFSPTYQSVSNFLSLHTDDLHKPWMLWRTLSYGFVHSSKDLWHIVWNMLGLWMLGRAVEEKYGKAEFLRIYLVAVFICGFLWLLLRLAFPGALTVCGASGAVCCIEMLFVLNFPRATLMLFGVAPVQAWVLGVILILGNFMTGSRGSGTVAWDVHLIGVGVACAYFYGKWNFSGLAAYWIGWRLLKRKLWGPKLRPFDPSSKNTDDEIEADRILDKIHQFGQDSLTSKEKRFLTNYSKAVRDKRQNTSP